MNATSYVIPAPPQAALPVVGESKSYPVRRIWCVGRNYLEHIREMGNDERAPPFFFAKHADMLVPDGATIPYPPLTKDLHHEVELIVAMKSGGLNIPADRGRSESRSIIPRPALPCSRPQRSAIQPRAGSGSRSTAPNSRRAISPN
jgi:hypothetical protein